MKDFNNQELAIGDVVICAEPHGRNAGASLQNGVVVGFTPKMVRISPNKDSTRNRLTSPEKVLKLNGDNRKPKIKIEIVTGYNNCDLGCGGDTYNVKMCKDDKQIYSHQSGGCFGSVYDTIDGALEEVLNALGYNTEVISTYDND